MFFASWKYLERASTLLTAARRLAAVFLGGGQGATAVTETGEGPGREGREGRVLWFTKIGFAIIGTGC